MTSKGLGEMFEGDSADMCAGKIPLMSMRGRAEALACADPGAKTPIGAIGNFVIFVRYCFQTHANVIVYFSYLIVFPGVF